MKSLGKRAKGLRLERMKTSMHWVDGAFKNLHPILPQLKSSAAMPSIHDFLCGGERRAPVAALPSLDPRPAWSRGTETGLRATWLGHSTVLLEIDGVRVLTDPVWGERASPLSIAGPKRFQPVPIAVSALPALDAVLISHDHYDHLDYPSIVELAKLQVPFITSLGVGAHLEAWGIPAERITELDWWESVNVRGGELRVTAAPSQHFSGRGMGSRNATFWSSFAITSAKHSVFFSGDTGLTTEYAEIRNKFGAFDLIMLEVGAFHPAWGDIHLGPEHALEALALLGGGSFLPIHWGTFNLAMHAWDEPAETLLTLAAQQRTHLLMPRIGEAIEPARHERVSAWWRETAALEQKQQPAPSVEPANSTLDASSLEWPID